MADEPEQYNLTAIRRVLLRAFNTDDLDDLFYFAATAELRAVRNEYVPSDSLRTKIRKAIDYCERRGLLDQLLVEIEQERPEQAEALQAELHKIRKVRQEVEEHARRETEAREQAERLETERLERERQEAEAAERLKAQLEELYQQAAKKLAEQDWAGGRKLLAQFEELEPGYRDVPELLHEADVQLARAMQVDGLMAQGTENLAEGKWWLASQAFRQVLDLAPDHALAQASLDDARRQEEVASGLVKGQNYFRAGRWAEAIACFEAVLEIDPKHREATGLLEEARAQERARLEEEARQAQQARDARLREEVLRTERTRLYDKGCAAAQEKDWAKAIESFEAVLKIDPDYLNTADRLAQARAQRDKETRRQLEAAGFRVATPEEGQTAWDAFVGSLAGEPLKWPASQPSVAKPADWGTVKTLKGHTDKVLRAAFSHDGKWVVTASEDKTARVWRVATGKTVAELQGHEEKLNCAAFGPDGTLIATASDDGRARVWQAATGQMVAETKKHGTWLGMGWQSVIGAAFLPDGSLVATTASDAKVRMWDPATGKFEGELLERDAFAMRAFCSPGGQGLLVEQKDGWGRLPKDIKIEEFWTALQRVLVGKLLAALGSDSNDPIKRDLALSADSKRAITEHHDGMARVWEVASGTLVRELPGSKDNPVRAVAFHPGGRWVATATGSKTVKVWNVDTGRVVTELRGHLKSVNSVAFSLDGELAVTASDDCTARVWQVPAS